MYQPSSEDLAWSQQMTRLIGEGGEWTWVETGMRMRFSHAKQAVTWTNPDPRFSEQWGRVSANFRAIGYSCLINQGPVPQPIKVRHMVVDLTGERPMGLGWGEPLEN